MTTQAKNPAPELAVSPHMMAQKLIEQLVDGMKTSELDELSAEEAYSLYTTHPDYGWLASRITVSAMHKDHRAKFAPTSEEDKRAKRKRGTFAAVVERIQEAGVKAGRSVYKDSFLENVRKHGSVYEAMIDHSADYKLTYFGLRTLKKGYLVQRDGIQELPQHLWMRVAVGFHGSNLDKVKETYTLLKDLKNIYGTPTEFYMGLTVQQLSSCFLTGIHHDSIEGIYDALKRCALISKTAGGIGLHIHNIRNVDAPINGTGGVSSGLVPMLQQFNQTARYVDQGGGKRPGAIATYFEPHIKEVRALLEMRRNRGDENLKARDLFYACWASELFMERVKKDQKWSLFCPSKARELSEVHGDEYRVAYEKAEQEGLAEEVVDAREIWFAMIESQIETGTPYLLNKDACNAKSNHKHLGTIKCSNLCTEIVEYTAPDETAVCNLASMCLPEYVKRNEAGVAQEFDHEEFHKACKVVVKNLNIVIDINDYPVIDAGRSNRRHRPVGMGVQGLDDLFKIFEFPFDSEEALQLDTEVFETMYHATTEAGIELAEERREKMMALKAAHTAGEWNFDGLVMIPGETLDQKPREDPNYKYNYVVPGPRMPHMTSGRKAILRKLLEEMHPIPEEMALPDKWAGAYSSFVGSPMSQGQLQPDMWPKKNVRYSGRWDYEKLRQRVQEVGTRMSLTVAPMPTASTAQIEGNNEAFEPRTSNMYLRRVGAGEFVVMNEVLVRNLIARGKWTKEVKNSIIRNNGSVQQLPDDVLDAKGKALHKTAWEISMKVVIDHAKFRAPFIDQSMSMNLWLEKADYASMTSMLFYAWDAGLKTIMYYLRTRALASPQQVTIPVEEGGNPTEAVAVQPKPKSNATEAEKRMYEEAKLACSQANPEACLMCSS